MQNVFFYSTESSKLKNIEKQIAVDLSTNKLYYIIYGKYMTC